MPPAPFTHEPSDDNPSIQREDGIEYGLIGTLQRLQCEPRGARQTAASNPEGERCSPNQYRPDITDRASLEKNFREKFEALNRVRLTDAEFAHPLDEIVDYKNDPGNGYAKTLFCFMQIFIISNRHKFAEIASSDRLFDGKKELSLVA